MVSCHFGKKDSLALSAYNSTSQLGDFISLLTYFFIARLTNWPVGVPFFFAALYLATFALLAAKLIDPNLIQQLAASEIQPNKAY
jgi:hypothetical protein